MKQIFKQLFSWVILPIALLMSLTILGVDPAQATGVYQMPYLTAGDRTWVFDQDDVLSRLSEGRISNALDKLAKDTGNEVRIVTIHRLDYGETIESFTEKLFEKWFPTSEAGSHQTLLVLDTVTNTAAVRTGDGLKSILTDEIAQSVASETVLVPLKAGNKYNQALIDGSDRLVAVLSGQPDPGPPVVADSLNVDSTFASAEATESQQGSATIWVIGLLIAATVIPMVTYFWYQGFSG